MKIGFPNTKELIDVRFTVKRISFHDQDNHFGIVKATFENYTASDIPTEEKQHIIKGKFISIFEGDEWEARGYWVKHDIYGWQFECVEQNRVLPQAQKEIGEFLKRYIKGIGSKTANLIVETYKEDTFTELEKGWENISKIKGVGEKRAKQVHEQYMKHKNFENISMFVMSMGGGGTYKMILRIYGAFRESAIPLIRENPYKLCTIETIDFATADCFAKNLQIPFDDPLRVKESILYYLNQQMKQMGHLFVYRETLYSEFSSFLSKHGVYKVQDVISKEQLDSALNDLQKNNKISVENDPIGTCIYLTYCYAVEDVTVSLLKTPLNQEIHSLATNDQLHKVITEYEMIYSFKLAEDQKKAIYMALTEGVTILTGGPGTGKTQTTNAIIHVIKDLIGINARIKLCAPTGKASIRLTELTGMEAKTIHRLIGLKGEGVRVKEIEPIEADLLIVDEASMIDAFLFYQLLKSISPKTRLLIIGDYDQLPSVGAGLVLRDLIESEVIPVTRLTEIFRQAKDSQIVGNAHAVIKGDETALNFDHSKEDCYWIETADKIKIQEKLMECMKRLTGSNRFSLDDIQVLLPLNGGVVGVNDLNFCLQSTFNPRQLGKDEIKIETSTLRVGDKVMQTINNYELGVFNGEVGKIKEIIREFDDVEIAVDYGDKSIVYSKVYFDELTLAYAISIHKSQGAEFKCVFMVIDQSHEFMLNRNLIYTGMTRAKQMLTLIGQRKVLNESIKKQDNTQRNSRLKEKLSKSVKSLKEEVLV